MTPPSELDTAPQPNLDPALHAGPSMFSGTAGSENSDEDDLPDDMKGFLAINAEKSKKWPTLTSHKEPAADAEEWKGVKDKLQYLEDYPNS